MIQDSASGRVVVHLSELVDAGRPGDRLPSVRQLMADLGVSPATVRAAVAELVRAERVEAVSGSGTFIAAKARRTADRDGDRSWQVAALGPHHLDVEFPGPLQATLATDTIDLASGYPDTTLHPTALVSKAMRDAARRPGTHGRVPNDGIEPLRAWFADQLHPRRDHEILITSGGQAALSLIFRSIALPGDTIVMESPTYIGAIAAARAAGLTPVAAPTDGDGLRIDRLDAVVESTGARLLYVQPRFHNPTGAHLAPERRTALMDLARERGLVVVEDDWLADFDDAPARLAPLAADDPDGHVVHVRSLSKSVEPAMRIAAIASQGAIAERLRAMRSVEDFFVSPILQETALGVVTSPAWQRHLRSVRGELAVRHDRLRSVLVGLGFPEDGNGGGPLHVWTRTPNGIPATAMRDAALRHGVSIVAGDQWFPSDPEPGFVRFSNASATTPLIAEAGRRLGQALATLR